MHERRKLARELHDGVLQSLTGVALQLELVARLVDKDPQAARALLREAQDLVVDEQRELRAWIESVSPAESASTAPRAELVAALEELSRRVSRSGPHVALSVSPTGACQEPWALMSTAWWRKRSATLRDTRARS